MAERFATRAETGVPTNIAPSIQISFRFQAIDYSGANEAPNCDAGRHEW
jgi:hypothetical protein